MAFMTFLGAASGAGAFPNIPAGRLRRKDAKALRGVLVNQAADTFANGRAANIQQKSKQLAHHAPKVSNCLEWMEASRSSELISTTSWLSTRRSTLNALGTAIPS